MTFIALVCTCLAGIFHPPWRPCRLASPAAGRAGSRRTARRWPAYPGHTRTYIHRTQAMLDNQVKLENKPAHLCKKCIKKNGVTCQTWLKLITFHYGIQNCMCLIDWSFAKSFKSSSNFAKKLAQKVLENICITKIAKICIHLNQNDFCKF